MKAIRARAQRRHVGGFAQDAPRDGLPLELLAAAQQFGIDGADDLGVSEGVVGHDASCGM
ncbi:hypothetical protein B7R78_0015475 [Ralstonia solanacearum]|nr:hypothetical protein [Ralstonia solanacearum]